MTISVRGVIFGSRLPRYGVNFARRFTNEGNEEVDQESKDLVRRFWSQMMARYKTEEEYNRQIIDAFKGSGDPEILIVVSKLLTGFDAPRNNGPLCLQVPEGTQSPAGDCTGEPALRGRRNGEGVRLHRRL